MVVLHLPSPAPQQWRFASVAGLGFFRAHPAWAHTILQPLQAVSVQPTPVLSPGLSSEAQVSAPSPCTYQQACILG